VSGVERARRRRAAVGVGDAVARGDGVGRRVRAVLAQLGAVEEAVVVAVGSSTLMRPSPSVSSAGFGSWPSITPSSSLSASFGSEPRKASPSSVRPSPSVSCSSTSSRRAGRRIRLARVERAVVVRVLGAVRDAAVVAVGVERDRCGVRPCRVRMQWCAATSVAGVGAALAELGAVEEAVVVAVRIERVDEARRRRCPRPYAGLGSAVDHAVVVAVGVVRIGPVVPSMSLSRSR
jgi:hypothetical protein